MPRHVYVVPVGKMLCEVTLPFELGRAPITVVPRHVYVVLVGKMLCEVTLLFELGRALITVVPRHVYVVLVGKMLCEVILPFEYRTAFRTFEKSIRVAFERWDVTWETDVLHFLTCVSNVFATDSNTPRSQITQDTPQLHYETIPPSFLPSKHLVARHGDGGA